MADRPSRCEATFAGHGQGAVRSSIAGSPVWLTFTKYPEPYHPAGAIDGNPGPKLFEDAQRKFCESLYADFSWRIGRTGGLVMPVMLLAKLCHCLTTPAVKYHG